MYLKKDGQMCILSKKAIEELQALEPLGSEGNVEVVGFTTRES